MIPGITSGKAAAVAAVTWSPTDKGANLTLSGGNLIVTKGGGEAYSALRATLGRSTGKYYFEIVVTQGGTSPFMTLGIANAAQVLNNFVGSGTDGWSYYQETGTKITAGAGTAYGAAYTTADVIGVAADLDAGKVWFAKNNTYQASGDPAAGTNQAFSGLTGTLFPAAALYRGTATSHVLTARFAAASFSFSPPAGFSAWG